MRMADGHYRKMRVDRVREGHAHELTFSCYKKLRLLNRDRTRRWFVEALDAARRKLNFKLIAFVIMPDHCHVIMKPRENPYSMGGIRKAIKQPVGSAAIAYLRAEAPEHLHRLRTPAGTYRFWEAGGGYDRNIWTREAMQNAIRYTHLNPVRGGLVERDVDWAWSSARWYFGHEDAVLAMDEA